MGRTPPRRRESLKPRSDKGSHIGNLYNKTRKGGQAMTQREHAPEEYRPGFETFKSNVCHFVKDMGDLAFIIDVLEKDKITELWNKRWYAECLYLLAMTDYLSRENDLPPCNRYDEIRRAKLKDTIYPTGVLILCAAEGNDDRKQTSLKEAIPEFMRHNIVESEVRDVV
jgi:hypothetical protein